MKTMKSNYLHFLSDIYYFIRLSYYMYHSALQEEEYEGENLTHELDITHDYLEGTQRSLQELEILDGQLHRELERNTLSPTQQKTNCTWMIAHMT